VCRVQQLYIMEGDKEGVRDWRSGAKERSLIWTNGKEVW
jgi:hypothetical protein